MSKKCELIIGIEPMLRELGLSNVLDCGYEIAYVNWQGRCLDEISIKIKSDALPDKFTGDLFKKGYIKVTERKAEIE